MRVTVKNESHIFRSTSQRTNESVYFVNLEDDITLTLAKRAQNVEQMVFVQQLATAKARQIMAVQRNRMLN